MPFSPKQILSLSSATTTKLVTSAYHADDTYPNGIGYGVPGRQQFFVQVIRGSTSMTGVTFQLQGSRDPAATVPVWIPILTKLLSDDGTIGFTLSQTVSASSASANEDVMITEDCTGIPYIRVVAKSIAADASTGDSCVVRVWV
jgi:hypothetical protein